MRILIYRGYQVKQEVGDPHSWKVVTDGKGGKIPRILEGYFTSPVIAKSHIDSYLDNKTVAV